MKTNKIHPTAIIGENVKLGRNNTVGAYTIIEGPIEIGDNNLIGSHVILGCAPTDTKHVDYGYTYPIVKIGNNNVIREYSLIEQPCYEEETIIGNHVFIMQGVHVSHDCHVSDNSVLTNMSVLAGLVKILEGANVAMGCTINQYTVIGHYSIVATNAACMKNVKPFSRYIPNKPNSVNYYAIKKYGFEEYTEEIENYVLQNIHPRSARITEIIDEFNHWVDKYGHDTYDNNRQVSNHLGNVSRF